MASPCLLGLSSSEELWSLGVLSNLLLAGAALAGMGARAVLSGKA